MKRFIYTNEMIDYIREIAPGKFNDEITEMFNDKFNLNKTVKQINSMKRNHRISSGKLPKRTRPHTSLFNEEQHKFIERNVEGLPNQNLANLINEKYKLSITTEQIKNYKRNHGLSSGLTGHFTKNHKPWNAGLKGIYTGGEKGWFKKGQESHNKLPIGTEVVVEEGYKETKIAEPNVWKRNHIILWEREHGIIPAQHVIVFLDQDKTNITIDNLAILHRRELSMMNYYGLFSNNAQETLVGISIIRLIDKTNEAERMGNNREKYNEHKEIAKRNGISEQVFTARIKRGWNLKDATYKPLHSNVKR